MVYAHPGIVIGVNMDNGIVEHVNHHKGVAVGIHVQFGVMFGEHLANGISVEFGRAVRFAQCNNLSEIGYINGFIQEHAVLFHHANEMFTDECVGWIIVGKAKINASEIHFNHGMFVIHRNQFIVPFPAYSRPPGILGQAFG